jgi:hypothetical protein
MLRQLFENPLPPLTKIIFDIPVTTLSKIREL